MNKSDFLIAMKLLKAFYIDWAFNFDDRIQVETWHEYLKVMDFDKFKKVINFYISKHDSGPNNPGELLKAQIEYDMKQMINNGEPI